jgi:uncharacterized protein with PIN domain
MTTPVEIHSGWKLLATAKNALSRVFALGKRIATLEERVTALEAALAKQPGDACPYCGERAMRLMMQGSLLGNQGNQWTEEIWLCHECNQSYEKRRKL